ncbi:MAG: glycoside hydrolase family 6 protein [Acidimicrobiales bacterium]
MTLRMISSGWRRTLALAAVSALTAAGLVAATPFRADAAPGCSVSYQAQPWTEGPGVGGYTANVTITNTGDPINGWNLVFSLPSGQSFTQGWSAAWSPGPPVSATNLDWNASLPTGASMTIGFNGRWTGSFTSPTSFAVNGTTCGGGGTNQPPTVTLTSPTANQAFAAGDAIPLTATASDPDGTVNLVEFLVDGAVVGTDTSSPYSFSAPAVASGNHTAQARAVDDGTPAANTTTSPVPFTMAGGTPSVTLSPASLTVVEGASAPLTVRLSAAPAAGTTVDVALARTGDTSITVTPAQVGLSSANWQAGANVTVSAAEDADQLDGTATINATASGHQAGSAAVTEDDNDGGPANKVDNPFTGATGYVNSAWQGQVNIAANDTQAAGNATLAARMRVVGQQSTAVWIDRIAAIDPAGTTLGLADHLNAAVQQDAANGAAPLAIQIVIYDLPNRDCAALASNGELLIAQNGLARYRTEYIDPIRTILANPAYANLRMVLIIEPDSLPNLVTNISGAQASQRCIEAQQTGAYRDGVRYAVSQLSSLANTYLYLDIAHSGWLGWPNNFDGTLNVYDQVMASGQGGPGYDKIHGFITNTANYTPLDEVFLSNPNLQVGSGQVMSSTFYEFNPRFDERDFATNLQAAFAARGCTNCGMLIDTSRNGWGGSDRPTQVSTSTDLNTYVNQSRIDRRPHRGGWCNQSGAGIGVRPTASTGISGVDAFVWVKPPGESDGVAMGGVIDPDDPNKGFDAMCDPNAQNRYNSAFPTNALAGAPHAGRWFPAQFTMLVQNAFPVIPTS